VEKSVVRKTKGVFCMRGGPHGEGIAEKAKETIITTSQKCGTRKGVGDVKKGEKKLKG